MRHYKLYISEKQAQTIILAMDLYTRIGLGQIMFPVSDVIRQADFKQPLNSFSDARDRLGKVAQLFTGYPPNASRGIGNKELPQTFKESWDILAVIRHRVSWDKNPDGDITVNFDSPMHWAEEPLPKIEHETKLSDYFGGDEPMAIEFIDTVMNEGFDTAAKTFNLGADASAEIHKLFYRGI